jgi:hypothetical protein
MIIFNQKMLHWKIIFVYLLDNHRGCLLVFIRLIGMIYNLIYLLIGPKGIILEEQNKGLPLLKVNKMQYRILIPLIVLWGFRN